METELILVDTNSIIEVLRNNKEIIEVMNAIGIEKIAVSCITVMELYYGALNKADLRKIKRYLEAFETIQINHEISQLAVDLVEKYAKSHNLNLPDALIASTSITHNLELYTLNLKDFRYIEGLKLWRYIQPETPSDSDTESEEEDSCENGQGSTSAAE